MQSTQVYRAPVCKKPPRPFISSHYHSADDVDDGIFRIVLITSGSVASIKAPDISPNMMSKSCDQSLTIYFYSQGDVDNSVRSALNLSDGQTGENFGVRVWTDEDEWRDWKHVGDLYCTLKWVFISCQKPNLISLITWQLRRRADLVVIAPCSADLLAKKAGGICDSLATCLVRALGPSTLVIVCPAMNTHMYQHCLTARHLTVVQEDLEYLVSGPQEGGRLACGDDDKPWKNDGLTRHHVSDRRVRHDAPGPSSCNSFWSFSSQLLQVSSPAFYSDASNSG
ncbi:phosphopantothenoylcysteine decarboxylase [Cryptococcus gattii Ru294]|nr:phosphopantothenoylcysteine decarboxylase [Cryptococcus gattii Ru294]